MPASTNYARWNKKLALPCPTRPRSTPIRECKYSELNNRVDNDIYDEVIDYAWDIGVRNAFTQDGESQSESFIPKWDFKG